MAIRVLVGKGQGDGGADAARTASDKRMLACKISHEGVLSLFQGRVVIVWGEALFGKNARSDQ